MVNTYTQKQYYKVYQDIRKQKMHMEAVRIIFYEMVFYEKEWKWRMGTQCINK